MTDVLLECRDVRKGYGSGVARTEVLKGISLAFPFKSRSVLLGASGAGKSTLLHVLSGLEIPDAGEVIFDGKSLGRLSDRELSDFRNRSIGFVFQFHHLMPEFTALENAAMPLLMRGDKSAYERAKHYLAALGVDHRLHHRPSEMSGGEQQRVAVARALVTEPRLVCADEPTGNLDHENSQRLIDLLMKVHEESGIALIVVTHNQEIARRFPRIIRLDDGTLQG